MRLNYRFVKRNSLLNGIMLLSVYIFFVLGCSHTHKESPKKNYLNLGSNPKYYKYVEYPSTHKFDHTLLFAIVEKRQEPEKVFNEQIQWFGDDILTEPPLKMMQKLFLKELRSSKMFKSVDLVEKDQSMFLNIELISLIGLYGENRMAKGRLKIHCTLKTLPDNRIVLDKEYEKSSGYKVHRFAGAYKHMLYHIGKATNAVVEDMMADMEQTLAKETRK